MKYINNLSKLLIIPAVVLLLFTACQNDIVETTTNNETELTINGKILIPGAAPSRTATSSFNKDITWIITAKDSKGSVTNPLFIDKNNFTLKLPYSGTWDFTVVGYIGKYSQTNPPTIYQPLFFCMKNCSIDENTADIQFLAQINESFLYKPSNVEDQQTIKYDAGMIKLPITDQTGKIKKISASLKSVYQPDESYSVPSSDFTGFLLVESIPAGVYTTNIYFEDILGNTLYSCTEVLNVFPGETTDTWFGTAPYFITEAGVTKIALSNELLNTYKSEATISTDYVLYSENTIYRGASLTEIGNEEYIPQQQYCKRIKSDFDSEGNVYTLIEKYESNGDYYYGLSLYENNNTTTPLLDTVRKTTENGGFYFKSFSIDRVSDTFYFSRIIRENYGDQSYVLYKCPKSALSSFINSIDNYDFTISGISDSVINNNKFAVYEDVMYIASGNTLKAINVSDIPDSSNSTPELSDSEVQTYSYVEGTFSTVTDILYQDKAIYILNQYSEGNTNMNQEKKGLTLKRQSSLVKFSTLLKTFTTLGWNNSTLDTEGKWLYTYGVDSYNILDYQYFTDAACSSHVLIKADDIVTSELKLYFTASDGNKLSTTGFYGPQAFVAIKPKQLVIADDGLAIYTDAYGLFRGKNVNRVVFVDLENFAISDTKELTNSITFGGEQTGLPLSLCTFAWGPENLYNENHELFYDKEATPADTTIYYKDNNENKSKSLSFSSLIVGIPVDSE